MEIIVDLCNQHYGDVQEIKRMILSSFVSGADVIKIQIMDSTKFFGDNSRKYRDLSFDQTKEVCLFCESLGIEFMASVFDEEKLEWIQELGVKRHKIPSKMAFHNHSLCNKILKDNKETIISTGLNKPGEFPFGFDSNIKYCFCVPKYPTFLYDEALKKMPKKFSIEGYYGYSDHTIGIAAPLEAHLRGAKILEKHFTNNMMAQNIYESAHLCSFDAESLKRFRKLTKELDILRSQ